ncbi:DUF692 family protein [Nonomuraea sp. PA05]|nr:DUF692 family protein [Nonomuraea sp. PA05]
MGVDTYGATGAVQGETAGRIGAGGLSRLGLGVGLDMPWGGRVGFSTTGGSQGGDGVTPAVREFLERRLGAFSYLFFSFQPRDYGPLEAARYYAAYDDICGLLPADMPRVFHHTRLNIGNPEPFDKEETARFTNDLIARYGFSWVVEDLGIWSFRGKSLPYPLPPLLTPEGREMCVEHATQWRRLLDAPISIEFPGFTEGGTFCLGHENAFQYFSDVVETADVLATIDIGHIISYQWIRGVQGEAALRELELLPLDRCIEFHLSGCQIVGNKFRDLHHGILLDEQLELLEHLLPLCPNLIGVTYEDPVFDNRGDFAPKTVPNYLRLADITERWCEDAR